jgi:anti-sigma B factor antagonist
MPSTIRPRPIRGGVLRVVLAGEFDLTAAPALSAAIRDALAARRVREVQIDLYLVEFVDAVTLGVLLDGRDRAALSGIMYRVVNARGMPLRLLLITGMLDALTGPGAGSGEPPPRHTRSRRLPMLRHRHPPAA